jgi:phosphoribosylanthranilate isomerase
MNSARTRIKICGLKQAQDVAAAVQAGADAVGFVLYEKSVRHVTLAQATALAKALPAWVTPVLLFVNAAEAEVQAAMQALPHATLQFHGDEPPAFCEQWGRPYLRAVAVTEGVDLLNWCDQFKSASALLLDAPVTGFGGGGKVFDWTFLESHLRLRNTQDNVGIPLVLSGGLDAANVTDGIKRIKPYAVDVSSGVERERGIKDPQRIRDFCAAVRLADQR